jgi:hypothetical protein
MPRRSSTNQSASSSDVPDTPRPAAVKDLRIELTDLQDRHQLLALKIN